MTTVTIKRAQMPVQEWVKDVTIRCPECGTIQPAQVVKWKDFVWPAYVHDCSQCNYTITESEWNEA